VQRLTEATLEDYGDAWEQESGQPVSIQTMSRTLIRFGWPRKKRQWARLNVTKSRADWRG